MIKELFKKIYSFKITEQFYFNPFINFKISSIGDYQGANNGVKRKTPIIITIYSEQKDYDTLPVTIYSLLNQSLKPDQIILLLDKKDNLQSLPYEITQFIKNGLEIKFIDNLGKYTDTFYAMNEYPNAINAIAQSGIYYKSNWLKNLYASYIIEPKDIHINLAKKLNIDNGKLLSAKHWNTLKNENSSQYSFIMNRDGGVLFPPNCFNKDFLRKDIFLKYAPLNPELWYWAMAIVNNRKTRIIRNNTKHILYLNIDKIFKKKENYSLIDEQVKNLMKFYQQNIINKLL